jgi:hypothetical protein
MSPKICIFCRKRRADSIEDAVPCWLLEHHEHLYGAGPVTRRWGVLDDPARMEEGTWDGYAVTVRSVCRVHCNNGWMADLEGEAGPLIKPMMSGIAVPLHAADQRILAFWALKSAITLQEANRSRGLPIPPEHIASVYSTREERPRVLPEQVSVWLTSHSGPSKGLGYLVAFPPGAEKEPLAKTGRQRYWVSFRFGRVAFHILGHTSDPRLVRVAHNPQSLLRLWPASPAAVEWPPLMSFDDDGFEQMARTVLPKVPWADTPRWSGPGLTPSKVWLP